MAKFPLQRAPEKLGVIPTTAVRAGLDVSEVIPPDVVPTGEERIGQAIAGLGGAAVELGTGLRQKEERLAKQRSAIELKRQQMMDANLAVQAQKIRDLSNEEFKTHKATNPQETWESFRRGQTEGVAGQIAKLPFSPDALEAERIKSEAYSAVETAKALTAATLQLRQDTIEAQTEAMVDAFRLGTPEQISEVVRRYIDNGANMGKDKVEVLNDIKAAREAGEKLRNQDAVKAKRNQASLDPAGVKAEMTVEQELRRQDKGSPELVNLFNEDLEDIIDFADSVGEKERSESKVTVVAAIEGAYSKIRDGATDIDAMIDAIAIDPIILDEDSNQAAEKIKTFFSTWHSAVDEKVATSNSTRIKALNIISEVRNDSVVLAAELEEFRTLSNLEKGLEKYKALARKEEINPTDSKAFIANIFTADESVKTLEGKAIQVAKSNADDEGKALMSQRFVGIQNEEDLIDLFRVAGLTDEEKKRINRQWTAEVNNRALYERAVDNRFRELQEAGITDIDKYTSESLRILLQYQRRKQLSLEKLEEAVGREQQKIILRPVSELTADEARAELARRRAR